MIHSFSLNRKRNAQPSIRFEKVEAILHKLINKVYLCIKKEKQLLMPKHPAVFLDRDGTIIEDVGYIHHSSLVAFYPFSFKALQTLQNHFLLFIVTNQSGIAKGIVTEKQVIAVNQHITDELRSNEIAVYDTFYCPHKNEDACHCKKPSPFFLNLAARLYNVDLSRSFIIGDHPSDVECGTNAGVTPIYVKSGHGAKHQSELNHEVHICGDLLEASELILSTIKR